MAAGQSLLVHPTAVALFCRQIPLVHPDSNDDHDQFAGVTPPTALLSNDNRIGGHNVHRAHPSKNMDELTLCLFNTFYFEVFLGVQTAEACGLEDLPPTNLGIRHAIVLPPLARNVTEIDSFFPSALWSLPSYY
jgi:hypothetical protein